MHRRQPFAPHERILLVDDDVDSRDALELFLTQEGYGVVAAGSSEEGFARLREGGFGLVLTDYMLPDQTGAQMIERARAEGLARDAFVIMLSAHPEPPVPEGAALLRKPIDLDRLLHAIEDRLGPARRPAAAGAVSAESPAPASAPPPVELVLYVTSGSAASRRAVRNAERVLRAHPPSLARLSVRDMAEFADEAAADRVDFTPALVRLRPAPRALLLGDLRDASALEELLRDAEPEPAR